MIKSILNGFFRYIKRLILIHTNIIKEIITAILENVSPSSACKIKNLEQKLRGKKVHFNYEQEKKLFTANADGKTIFFADKMRGFELYKHGINKRGLSLARSYFLDKIKFSPKDIVIDCGANYGDIWLELGRIEPSINYISFEPSKAEHECIKLNIPNQQHHNIALYNKTGSIEFYLSTETGDSSILEPKGGYTKKVQIEAISIDDFVKDFETVKLLKLEAEGLEPEILEGASETLHKIEYIAVDGGAERGLSEESTIEQISNVLIKNGFNMEHLDFCTGMGRALFKNTR